MKLFADQNLYCWREDKRCIGWAASYFSDCLCNIRDELSFGFGFVSLVCWGMAEIPQILTNFRTKSAHGVSLLFLLTWIAGDIFNMVGCLLEPATLPTQLYTAGLYTTTTVVLVLQTVYYSYICRWRNWRRDQQESDQEVDEKKPLKPHKQADSAIPIPKKTTSPRESYYYMSARSMAGSMTPPMLSHLWPVKSGPSALGDGDDSSDDDQEANLTSNVKSVSKPRTVPKSARYGAFLATSAFMPRETSALVQVYVGLTGRTLLQEHGSESVLGQWMGWMMAAIYMGGRLPQIWLNIKRGSVEGLNPLMFVFAIVANATYVASILVRSVAWDKIQANMPWLLDAVACVVLDVFVSSLIMVIGFSFFPLLKHFNACKERTLTGITDNPAIRVLQVL